MVTKLGRMVTYHEEPPLIKLGSFNQVVLWGHMTIQIVYITTDTRSMVTEESKVMVIYHEELPHRNSHTSLTCGCVNSSDKLKTLYLHFHNTYGKKTYQGGGIPCGISNHKPPWLLNEVVLWGHTTNEIIFTYRKSMDTKLDKVLTKP